MRLRKAKWVTFARKPKINGVELAILREGLGMSQEEFARKCGWTQQNQSILEKLGEHEVGMDVIELIQKAVTETA